MQIEETMILNILKSLTSRIGKSITVGPVQDGIGMY